MERSVTSEQSATQIQTETDVTDSVSQVCLVLSWLRHYFDIIIYTFYDNKRYNTSVNSVKCYSNNIIM